MEAPEEISAPTDTNATAFEVTAPEASGSAPIEAAVAPQVTTPEWEATMPHPSANLPASEPSIVAELVRMAVGHRQGGVPHHHYAQPVKSLLIHERRPYSLPGFGSPNRWASLNWTSRIALRDDSAKPCPA